VGAEGNTERGCWLIDFRGSIPVARKINADLTKCKVLMKEDLLSGKHRCFETYVHVQRDREEEREREREKTGMFCTELYEFYTKVYV